MANRIQLRRDTAANWAAANPILAQGEPGIELDESPPFFKIGDGVTHWNSLPYEGPHGTVTSVGLADGSTTPIFAISGSPVTTSGTLTFTLKTESPNLVFAGPASGSSAQPTFRSLVPADIPALPNYVNVVGTFDSQTPSPNGAVISGNDIYFQSASVSNPGMVDNTTQSFSGNKTFTGTVAITPSSTSVLTIDTTAFIFDSTNDTLGIGLQPATNTAIDILNTSGSSKAFQSTSYGVGSTNVFRGRFARGTVGTPAAAQAGDTLNVFSGRGYGASQFAATSTGVVNLVAGETFTNTSNQTYIQFLTTPTGSVTATESARIASTGVTLGPQSSSTAIHQINGGINNTTKTITAATYTVDTTTTDYIIYTDSTSNAITITLPAVTPGRTLYIYDLTGKAGTNHVTVVHHASETINGLTQIVIAQNYGGVEITGDGSNWFANVIPTSGNLVITAGTTYTTPVNITPQTRFKFTLVGGGGGGGGMNTASGNSCGGGGGGAGIVWLTGLTPNTGYAITIGAGGAQGSSTPTAGGNGGNTTLTVGATTYTAGGGGGGAATISTPLGGAGGTATNFNFGIVGQNGGGSGTASASVPAAPGGNAGFGLGLGGQGTVVFVGTDGEPGTGLGGGGSGTKGTNAIGGSGAQGGIIVEWSN